MRLLIPILFFLSIPSSVSNVNITNSTAPDLDINNSSNLVNNTHNVSRINFDNHTVIITTSAYDDDIDVVTTTEKLILLKGDKGNKDVITTTPAPQQTKGAKGEVGRKGIKGDKGNQGEVGKKGDRGDKGDQGIQGLRGESGRDGRDAPAPIDSIYAELEQSADETKIQWYQLDEDITFVISFGSTAFVLALLNMTCTIWLCWKRMTRGEVRIYGKLKENEMKEMHIA